MGILHKLSLSSTIISTVLIQTKYLKRRKQGHSQGGLWGLSTPLTSKIHRFQGGFRPQRLLSPPPPWKEKKILKPPLDKFLTTRLDARHNFLILSLEKQQVKDEIVTR